MAKRGFLDYSLPSPPDNQPPFFSPRVLFIIAIVIAIAVELFIRLFHVSG